MVNINSFLDAKWQEKDKCTGHNQQWYQSKIQGKPLRRIPQIEFAQRKIKREKKERIGKCIRQITKDCKDMLRKRLKKLKSINLQIHKANTRSRTAFTVIKRDMSLNLVMSRSKMMQNINKAILWKLQKEAYVYTIQHKPRSLKIRTWVLSKEQTWEHEMIFGEILIKNGGNGYLIPGVHYTPEITLNILSINLLKQQGFEIIFQEDKCTLEYMFKNQQGQNMDIDKMRQMHNDFLDDYFESLDKQRIGREREEPRKRFDKVLKWFYNHYLKRPLPGAIPPIIHGIPIHLFDLYKLIDCMGGYLSVQFGQEFGALAEILGLTRSDREEIKKCYMTYLEVFISYYKTARAPEDPIRGGEDSKSIESYQWNDGKTCAPIAVEKRKEKLEHFGIKLKEKEDCKQQQSACYEKEQSQMTYYKCQDFGHYAFECPEKNKNKDQGKYSPYNEPSTSRISDKE
uniref:ARID DNA-binding domain-containing protein n=1 Tax=Tanacetum cinerariifolium TaxID=118510 RepID=A0A6L2M6M9_TANCI|nr:ARID DNA-binding domain-containing protein [Tanacetum cinerariifolium]